MRARDERRRAGLRVILRRLSERYGRPAPEKLDEAVDVAYTLTSFETFDMLAGPSRSPEDVAPVVRRIVWAALGLEDDLPSLQQK